MKQINIFIELVICMDVECKNDCRKNFPRGGKSETAMAHENTT